MLGFDLRNRQKCVIVTGMRPFTLAKATNIAALHAASRGGLTCVLPLIGSKKTRVGNPLPFPGHVLMTPVSRANKNSGRRVLNAGSVESPAAVDGPGSA